MKRLLSILLLGIFFLFPHTSQARVIDAIAAIVNDEIITLQDLYHESAVIIRDTEKKGTLDNEARIKLRRTVLDRLVEKETG